MPEKTNLLDKNYFVEPIASTLEKLRAKARSKQRITYDCYSAIVKCNRVFCRAGYTFRSNGRSRGIALLSVLRGRSSRTCRSCLDYRG